MGRACRGLSPPCRAICHCCLRYNRAGIDPLLLAARILNKKRIVFAIDERMNGNRCDEIWLFRQRKLVFLLRLNKANRKEWMGSSTPGWAY